MVRLLFPRNFNSNKKRTPPCMVPVLIFFACFVVNKGAYAQQKDPDVKPTLVWANVGLGYVTGSSISGVSFTANAQYDSGIGLIGLRYMRADDTAMRGSWGYIDDIYELNLSYGYSHNIGMLNLSASAGFGYLWGNEKGMGSGDNGDFGIISFPVQGSITIQPVPFVGLGLMYSASINNRDTLSAASLVLQLGRLR